MTEPLRNPRKDLTFKAIFCQETEQSRKALKSFLTAAIEKEVSDIQLRPNEFANLLKNAKNPRLDLRCTFNDGEEANIELQCQKPLYNFTNRIVYYLSKLASSRLKKGQLYSQMRKTYQISVLDFTLFEKDSDIVHNAKLFTYNEKGAKESLSDLLNVITIELPKLSKLLNRDIQELKNIEKWGIFLKYADNHSYQELVESIKKTEEGIENAVQVMQEISMEYWDMLDQISDEVHENDRYNDMMERINLAKQEGLEEGISQGALQKALETARNMLTDGISLDSVSKYSGLPLETLEQLAKEIQQP